MDGVTSIDKAIRRTHRSDLVFYAILYSFFIVFSITILYPFYFLFINSLQGATSVISLGPRYLAPTVTTLRNYTKLLGDPVSLQRLFISVSRVFTGTFLNLFINSLVAFGLRKRNLKFRNIYLVLFTIPMFFGGGLIPTFLNLRMLGLIDTFLVYIIPGAFGFFNVIIFMACFRDIPESLEESAFIDGAGPFYIYFKIYVPLSIAVFATLGLFSIVTHWEAWFDSAYFTNRKSLETFALYLMKMVKKTIMPEDVQKDLANRPLDMFTSEGIKYASMIVASLPVIILYPFLQKYFVKGIKVGAIKG